jgi:hypothetical protein
MTRFYHRLIPFIRSYSENFSNTFFLALFAGIIFFTSGCEEDPTGIGSKLLPGSDFVSIKSTDTLKVRSFTMYNDSAATSNPAISYLGTIHDPYFGNTTAGFVSQLRLGSAWDDEYFVIDSIRLYLKFLNVTGITTEPHLIRLSEISERLYDSALYYSNQTVPLTDSTWLCTLQEGLKADTINTVTIDVPLSFGRYLTRDTSMFAYTSKKDFRSYFKGLYFQMEPSIDPLFLSLTLDYQGSYSYSNYFVLYMHDVSGNTKSFSLLLDAQSSNAGFNTFVHNFDAAEPSKKIQHLNDTTYLDTLSYAQTLNGVYTKIRIPGLELIKNNPEMDNIAVNKARLIFPVQYDNPLYKPSTIPTQVYMRYVTTTGYKDYVPDLKLISSSFFDGTPDTTKNVYNLNIATFVQGYLEDTRNYLKPELELFLSPSSPYNVLLKANNSHTPVKFEFTYTKF